MTGYVRTDTTNNIADGNIINAADLDNEFDGVQAAFNSSTGHNHDGTTGEGAPILALGPTQDVVVGSGSITPKTTNTVDLGSGSLKFKNLNLAGNAVIGGTLDVTGVATFTAQPVLSSLTASRAVFTDASKGLVSNTITGTGNVVMSTSPTLVTPILGTPTSATLTNATGLPIDEGTTGTLPVGRGGTGATSLTANNVILGNGTSAVQVVAPGTSGNVLTSNGTTWTSSAVSVGDVTLNGTQTLTNKTISADDNTLSGIAASSFVLSNGSGNIDGSAAQKVIPTGVVVGTTDTQTLTNKTLTSPVISSIINTGNLTLPTSTDTLVGRDTTDTLTNKTISADNNTLSGIAASSFVLSNGSGNIDGSAAQKAIPSGVVVGTTDTQTLTNKTLTAPTMTGAVLNDGYTEEVFAVTGTTPALSPTNGSIQTWTLSGNSTPTAGTWAAGQSITLMVDDGSASTITWTSLVVTWETGGGTPPSLSTTGYTVITLWKVDTTIYGAAVGG
jgi:hypothetical protein